MLHVLKYVVSCKPVLEINWRCAICSSRGLIWQWVCYLTLSSLLFCTNCVVVITECLNSVHFHYQWIGRLNKTLKWKAPQTIFLWYNSMCHKQDFVMEQNTPQAKLVEQNLLQARFFWLIETWWVVCPVDVVCISSFANRRSDSYLFNYWIYYYLTLDRPRIRLFAVLQIFRKLCRWRKRVDPAGIISQSVKSHGMSTSPAFRLQEEDLQLGKFKLQNFVCEYFIEF